MSPQLHSPLSAEDALDALVREILGGGSADSASPRHDPAAALRVARTALRQSRRETERLAEALRDLRSSRSGRAIAALRRLRQIIAPRGSVRAKIAGAIWRSARSIAGRPNGDSPTVDPATLRRQLAEVASRRRDDRELFVFAPSIPWDVPLFQRPQHLARTLAQQGHVVVYDCSGLGETVVGFRELEPNLFLFRGNSSDLANLPDPVLWTFTYNYPVRDSFPADCRVVYDWIDDLSVFPYDQAMLADYHRRALREATVVASVARALHDSAIRVRSDAILLPNAVEFERFAEPPLAPCVDSAMKALRAGGRPIAGYYGALANWFDHALLEAVSVLRPDWNFLLIGPDYDGSLPNNPLLDRPNVHWIGPRPYVDLPSYLHEMTCALIPFRINEITIATSPLKLYEYLAAGKPVIATPMPECAAHREVRIVDSPRAFAAALDESRTVPDSVRERFRAVGRANSWSARTTVVVERLDALRRGERRRAG